MQRDNNCFLHFNKYSVTINSRIGGSEIWWVDAEMLLYSTSAPLPIAIFIRPWIISGIIRSVLVNHSIVLAVLSMISVQVANDICTGCQWHLYRLWCKRIYTPACLPFSRIRPLSCLWSTWLPCQVGGLKLVSKVYILHLFWGFKFSGLMQQASIQRCCCSTRSAMRMVGDWSITICFTTAD